MISDLKFWAIFVVVVLAFGIILWFYERTREYSRIVLSNKIADKLESKALVEKEEEFIRRQDLMNKLGIILRARRIQESEFLDMCNKVWQPKNKIESLDQLEDKELEDLVSTYGVGVPGVGKANN